MAGPLCADPGKLHLSTGRYSRSSTPGYSTSTPGYSHGGSSAIAKDPTDYPGDLVRHSMSQHVMGEAASNPSPRAGRFSIAGTSQSSTNVSLSIPPINTGSSAMGSLAGGFTASAGAGAAQGPAPGTTAPGPAAAKVPAAWYTPGAIRAAASGGSRGGVVGRARAQSVCGTAGSVLAGSGYGAGLIRR